MTGGFDPDGLPPLREVIRKHDLLAKKSLGQHFLLDGNLTDRIARAAVLPPATDLGAGTTIEIGPGPGGLTRALLSRGATVLALEVDPRAMAAMADLAAAADGRLHAVEGDAMATDPVACAETLGLGPAYRIAANLPYNAGTAMLVRWLRDAGRYEGFTLMFQREVVDRLVATPGGRTYGRLSVLAQWLCETRRLFNVPAAAFTPAPKVMSAVVQLRPRAEPLAPASIDALERVTAAAFGQRRKMLRQSLKRLLPRAEAALVRLGIDPTARAETLTVQEFCAIARTLDGER